MLPMKDLLHSNKEQESGECVLRKPSEVGRFSLDGSRKFHHDRHQMTCFTPPVSCSGHIERGLDLNDGFNTDRFVKRDENVKERLGNMLRWLLENKHRFVGPSNSAKKRKTDEFQVIGDYPDFVLWRGHITKFMCTPYENRDGWEMACQKLNGVIFVSEVESKEAAAKRQNRSFREDLMTYWGVRFEGYMTGPFPKPGAKPQPVKEQTRVIVNTNKAFCAVFRSRLSQRHSLVYGAEVDCCLPVQTVTPPDCYVELKTSRKFSTKRQEDNFYRYKAIKWWAQSYLAGIPQITCGFRNDDGIVYDLEDFQTLDLPRRASFVQNSWKAETCLFFLDNLLQAIKQLLPTKHLSTPTEILLLKWIPGYAGVSYNFSSSEEDRFLPQWFVDEFK